MERLFFECPSTGRQIDTGIESELETLLRIRGERVLVRCPACGQPHEWHVNEAQLSRSARLPKAA